MPSTIKSLQDSMEFLDQRIAAAEKSAAELCPAIVAGDFVDRETYREAFRAAIRVETLRQYHRELVAQISDQPQAPRKRR